MQELLMLGALAVFIWLVRAWLGPPSAAARPGPNPEAEVPVPGTPIIIDTGVDTGG